MSCSSAVSRTAASSIASCARSAKSNDAGTELDDAGGLRSKRRRGDGASSGGYDDSTLRSRGGDRGGGDGGGSRAVTAGDDAADAMRRASIFRAYASCISSNSARFARLRFSSLAVFFENATPSSSSSPVESSSPPLLLFFSFFFFFFVFFPSPLYDVILASSTFPPTSGIAATARNPRLFFAAGDP